MRVHSRAERRNEKREKPASRPPLHKSGLKLGGVAITESNFFTPSPFPLFMKQFQLTLRLNPTAF
jgi:hypothetical protein